MIYWYHSEEHPVVLLFVFAKSETDDLSAERRKFLVRIAARLNEEVGSKK